MEWREQSAVSCEEAYLEAQRWIEVRPADPCIKTPTHTLHKRFVLTLDRRSNSVRGYLKRV